LKEVTTKSETVRETIRERRDTVSEVMSKPGVTVAASLTISSALARFVVSVLRHR